MTGRNKTNSNQTLMPGIFQPEQDGLESRIESSLNPPDSALSTQNAHSDNSELSDEEQNVPVEGGIISENHLKSFLACPYRYFLENNVGFSKIPTSMFAAMALFFSQYRKSLYNLHDSKAGRPLSFMTRAGRDLKTAEEMTGEELQLYLASKSAETYGNTLSSRFLHRISSGEYNGSDILWSFENNDRVAAAQLHNAGGNYYNFVLQNGPPIYGYVNKEAYFEFEGHRFLVKFPELRRGMIIDDPTIGGFNRHGPDERNTQAVRTSPLVTLRILAFARLANQQLVKGFPSIHMMRWGIDERVAESWGGNPVYLDRRITYRHIACLNNDKPRDEKFAGVKVQETTRSNEDLDGLRMLVDAFLDYKSRQDFPPRQQSCGSCPYNSLLPNGGPLCTQRRAGVKPSSVPKKYLGILSYEEAVPF